jgi:hypothetical protein
MEITDKDRLDFIEKSNKSIISPDAIFGWLILDIQYFECFCKPGVICDERSAEKPTVREAIDSAIMAMREKDK